MFTQFSEFSIDESATFDELAINELSLSGLANFSVEIGLFFLASVSTQNKQST